MEGELFSHSQTFLGVLLTLVVLCLFNNESNFLLELLTTFNNDMENYLKNCLDSLKKDISAKFKFLNNGAYDKGYWETKLDDAKRSELLKIASKAENTSYNFFNKGNELIDQYTDTKKKRVEKKEILFIELHFFFVGLLLMTIDACCKVGIGWAFFVLLLVLQSMTFTTLLWVYYFKNIPFVEEYPSQLISSNSCLFFGLLKNIGLPIVGIILLLFPFCFFNSVLLECLILVIFLIFAFFHSKRALKDLNHYKYNSRFVLKHTIYMLFIAFVVAIIVKMVLSDKVSSYLSNCNWDDIATIAGYWKINIKNLSSLNMLGDFFVVYFVLVCFIAPLLIGYWQDRKTARDVLSQLQMENEKCKKEAKKMASDYKDLIDDFVQTHK